MTAQVTEHRNLKEHLCWLIEGWEQIPIRVLQDGRWQSLYLSEIKDGLAVLDWIKSTKGRFWE